ncbi:hypothetical protein CAPTEDRAFT_187233 [Capitella teleta]|uniref:Uncharacterized protein n=1 Tax=Capitella teleta TaxID=283909 RepID=X1ZK25_CAPTE|nr:hypothetical protein CAPTEDRAFT_187233 [Capitella teleta]|eukprot:ELU10074.1 hypothetical protein CAPTEDRAFT_187233 [Capitella teleta]
MGSKRKQLQVDVTKETVCEILEQHHQTGRDLDQDDNNDHPSSWMVEDRGNPGLPDTGERYTDPGWPACEPGGLFESPCLYIYTERRRNARHSWARTHFHIQDIQWQHAVFRDLAHFELYIAGIICETALCKTSVVVKTAGQHTKNVISLCQIPLAFHGRFISPGTEEFSDYVIDDHRITRSNADGSRKDSWDCYGHGASTEDGIIQTHEPSSGLYKCFSFKSSSTAHNLLIMKSTGTVWDPDWIEENCRMLNIHFDYIGLSSMDGTMLFRELSDYPTAARCQVPLVERKLVSYREAKWCVDGEIAPHTDAKGFEFYKGPCSGTPRNYTIRCMDQHLDLEGWPLYLTSIENQYDPTPKWNCLCTAQWPSEDSENVNRVFISNNIEACIQLNDDRKLWMEIYLQNSKYKQFHL